MAEIQFRAALGTRSLDDASFDSPVIRLCIDCASTELSGRCQVHCTLADIASTAGSEPASIGTTGQSTNISRIIESINVTACEITASVTRTARCIDTSLMFAIKNKNIKSLRNDEVASGSATVCYAVDPLRCQQSPRFFISSASR